MNQLMEKMSLREKIGQLLCLHIKGIGYENRDPDYLRVRNAIAEEHIGGLILFHGKAEAAAKLLNEYQGLSRLPLLVSSDIERGVGQILEGGSEFPTNMALGATFHPEFTQVQGKITAIEARAVGIHVAYAPVADVNSNPDNPIINIRSYGEDPNWVARFVEGYIQGVQENDVLATAKHFPGHGDTAEDSHARLPVLDITRDRFNRVESIPFRKAIEGKVAQIMSAHIAFPELTQKEKIPATLSREILTGLLRDEMGFEGLIVTDALNMAGVADHFSEGEMAVLAIEAGVDILLYPKSAKVVVDSLEKAVESGRISKRRIEESVLKILNAKKDLGLFNQRTVQLEKVLGRLNTKESCQSALEVARASITLICPDKEFVPFKGIESQPNKPLANIRTAQCSGVSWFPLSRKSPIQLVIYDEDNSNNVGESLISELSRRDSSFNKPIIATPDNISPSKGSLDRLDGDKTFVIGIFSRIASWKEQSGLNPKMIESIHHLLNKHPKTLVISFASPYIYNELQAPDMFICTYSSTRLSQIACVEALYGEIPIGGLLPVSLKGYPLLSPVDKEELQKRSDSVHLSP